jgi:hypothetical protein
VQKHAADGKCDARWSNSKAAVWHRHAALTVGLADRSSHTMWGRGDKGSL